ncbi:cysteine-rich protein 2 isoform X1 [Oryzias latipes]
MDLTKSTTNCYGWITHSFIFEPCFIPFGVTGLPEDIPDTHGRRQETPWTGEKKRSLGRDYHPLCLKCFRCKRQLTAGQHAEYDERPFCSNCYMKTFGPRGNR